jgi:hypothetical protein
MTQPFLLTRSNKAKWLEPEKHGAPVRGEYSDV